MSVEPWNGLVGGLVGAGIGVAGALWGTLNSIRRTQGPAERAFMKRACAWGWGLGSLSLASLLLIPAPWSWLSWIVYGPALVWGLRALNAGQVRAKQIDGTARPDPE